MTSSSIVVTVAVLVAALNAFVGEPFRITTKRTDDRVELKAQDGKVLLVIRSPTGISHATIERSAEQWPSKVVIQLRLNGLENFKLSSDKTKLEASVSSHNGSIRLWMDGQEDSPLDSKSPYWMNIRTLDSNEKTTKTIPLKDGCFELELPKKFFESNPKSFKIEWIDFYRN